MVYDGMGWFWDCMGCYEMICDGMRRVLDGIKWYMMVWDGMGWYGMV